MSRDRPARLPWWAEAVALFALYQLFEYLRTLVVGRSGPALRHARGVVHVERWLRLYPEPGLNAAVSAHTAVAQAMDIYYGTIHFVVPPLVLWWLWRRQPDEYTRWRNVLIAVSVAGLILFALYPLAPPRLTTGITAHFVDTAVRFGGLGPLDRGNFVDKNPYAAMPSLHMAWSGWCAMAVIVGGRAGRRPAPAWRWLMLAYPAATLTVVMGTANHWLLDGVAGVVLLVAACAILDAARVPGTEEVRTDGEIRTPQ